MTSGGIPSGWGYRIDDMPKEKPRIPIPFEQVVDRLLSYKPKQDKPLKKQRKKKEK